MNRIGVMQVIDTLALGGLERVAVNIANMLPCQQFRSFLCATRKSGPLQAQIDSHVQSLCLHRAARFDPSAALRMRDFIQKNNIRLVHAHGTSLFLAVAVAATLPRVRIVWHDHFGRQATHSRPAWVYRPAVHRTAGVIVVNKILADWSHRKLRMPEDRVWYLPNFICEPRGKTIPAELPGNGPRIVCVANFRPQKDHATLLRAMQLVVEKRPGCHLILVGGAGHGEYALGIQAAIGRDSAHVTWLGEREDVPAILAACDVGVLSSASEGLPLALIEYGMAELPVVATHVGQCAEVLDNGAAGILVPAGNPNFLAEAILSLLDSPGRRTDLSMALSKRVRGVYSAPAALRRITEIYSSVLSP